MLLYGGTRIRVIDFFSKNSSSKNTVKQHFKVQEEKIGFSTQQKCLSEMKVRYFCRDTKAGRIHYQ